jgi:hypothetical protein
VETGAEQAVQRARPFLEAHPSARWIGAVTAIAAAGAGLYAAAQIGGAAQENSDKEYAGAHSRYQHSQWSAIGAGVLGVAAGLTLIARGGPHGGRIAAGLLGAAAVGGAVYSNDQYNAAHASEDMTTANSDSKLQFDEGRAEGRSLQQVDDARAAQSQIPPPTSEMTASAYPQALAPAAAASAAAPVSGGGPSQSAPVGMVATKLWSDLDTNHDGTLELANGQTLSQPQFGAVVQSWDTSGDGQLDGGEMLGGLMSFAVQVNGGTPPASLKDVAS